jgi:hypothetical protein
MGNWASEKRTPRNVDIAAGGGAGEAKWRKQPMGKYKEVYDEHRAMKISMSALIIIGAPFSMRRSAGFIRAYFL